jgi:hypothetical protein
MSKFKFSSAAVPQAPVVVEGESILPKPILSDAERIEAARAVGIQSSRQAAKSDYGRLAGCSPAYIDAYFRGWNGHPSCWLAVHIYFLAGLIETRLSGKLLPIAGDESYDGAKGTFASLGGFSFDTLTTAYKRRITELGINEALLEEFAATIHPIAEDREFYALDFAGRMERFKESKA